MTSDERSSLRTCRSRAVRPTSSFGSRPAPDARRPRPRAVGAFGARSGDADVLRLRTLGAGGDVELHLLVLVQRLVTTGLDGGVVNEDVLTATVLRDEAETLFGVEPLDGSLSHVRFPLFVPRAPCPQAAEDTHLC